MATNRTRVGRDVASILAVLLLLSLLGFIHFGNTTFTARNIIDYDDLTIVKPILSIDWHTYFFERFPDRSLYAFPFTDFTIMFDSLLANRFGIPFHWLMQFFYFSVGVVGWIATSSLFLKSRWQILLFAFLLGVHPVNTEVLQWITQRRYTVQEIFLAWGTYLFCRILKRDEPPLLREWALLAGCWFGALLAYPNSVLWLPCITSILIITKRTGRGAAWTVFGGSLLVSLIYVRFTTSGTGGWSTVASSIFTEKTMFDKALYFGIRAAGRATWNLIFPFSPAPYYNEESILGWIGLTILVASTLFLIASFRKRFRVEQLGQELRRGPLALLLLAGALTLPAANTILPFADFMLADRHLFLALPPLLLILFILWNEAHKSIKITTIAAAVGFIWTAMAIRTVWIYSPSWENDFVLMGNCAREERSARCISQVIRRRFFKGQCSSLNEFFKLATDLYPKRPPYTSEFTFETPLYHSACVGLSLSMGPEQRRALINHLTNVYQGSAELIMGDVLSELRQGNRGAAWQLASEYYAGPLPLGPARATYTTINIYRGHLRALCKILGTAECLKAESRFKEMHLDRPFLGGADNWGYQITMTASGANGP